MTKLLVTITSRKAVIQAKEEKKRKETETQLKTRRMLTTALAARNIRVRRTKSAPDLEDAVIHLGPDPLAATSALYFPVVILYPLDAQSDFIKALAETDTITEHLGYIFPLPWDTASQYTVDGVEIYMETASGGLIKVGKKMTVLRILSSDGVEVVDDLVKINIVPKVRSSEWIEQMKTRRGK